MSRYAKYNLSSEAGRTHLFNSVAHDLHDLDGNGLLAELVKAQGTQAASEQGEETGEIYPGIDYSAATRFRLYNIHHARCLDVKRWATIGLGLEDESIERMLNPLCRISWQTQLAKVVDDYFNVGNGYLEVVRRGGPDSPITGLFHVPAASVGIYLEDPRGVDRHFVVHGKGLMAPGRNMVRMAEFGDAAGFRRRRTVSAGTRVSEIIHFPDPNSLDTWYGVASWLAAAATIELAQAMMQHQFDFHRNRGVPEMLLFLTGGRVDDDTWDNLKKAFGSFVGLGNQHKSGVFNITNPDIQAMVEKIGSEDAANGTFFRDMMEALAVTIVSAHGVPPALAGILIPGKMGAANEASNAAMMFQSLTVGPQQHHFETILNCTLGGEQGIEGITDTSFQFKTIVDELAESMKKLQPMDTMGRMRDELGEAASEGRDLEAGLEKMETVQDFIEVAKRVVSRRAA